MKNELIKNIDNAINSVSNIDEQKNLLKDLNAYILDTLESLEQKQVECNLKSYIAKFNDLSYNDSNFTLEKKISVDRSLQDIMVTMFEDDKMQIDNYGTLVGEKPDNIKEEYKSTFEAGGFENDTFYIRPYNWNGISYEDCNCGLDDEIEGSDLDCYEYGFHSKDCSSWETNFYYKPTGLKLAWYKYPLRSAYANQEIDKDTFKAIIKDCIDSVHLSK